MNLRLGGGAVLTVILGERGAESAHLTAADVQPCGQRVTAETGEMLCAGGQRFK